MGLSDGGLRPAGLRNLTQIIDKPDSAIDNFEDADANPPGVYETGETISDYYAGDLTPYQRTTSSPHIGSQSLLAEDTANEYIVSLPEDGLNRYPGKGETFSCLMEFRTQSGDPNMGYLFGMENATQGYIVQQNNFSGALNIYIFDDGRGTNISGNTSFAASTGVVYEYEVQWGLNDDIIATVYEYDTSKQERGAQQAQASANDGTYNGQGVGFWAGGDTAGQSDTKIWDRYRVI